MPASSSCALFLIFPSTSFIYRLPCTSFCSSTIYQIFSSPSQPFQSLSIKLSSEKCRFGCPSCSRHYALSLQLLTVSAQLTTLRIRFQWMNVGPAEFIKLSSETGAACLDGSPFGFYFRKSSTGSTQWTVGIQGGGWCYDEKACLHRANTTLGSSKAWGKTFECNCRNVRDTSGFADDCNCVYLRYCDGASFSGYTDKPVAVGGGKIIFRGMRNLDATVAYALDHLGMKQSTQVGGWSLD